MCRQRNGEASFNLKAAPALGLDVPRKLCAFVDELIESVDDRSWPWAAWRCVSPRSLTRSKAEELRGSAAMGGDLKATATGNLFVIFGEPDIKIEDAGDDMKHADTPRNFRKVCRGRPSQKATRNQTLKHSIPNPRSREVRRKSRRRERISPQPARHGPEVFARSACLLGLCARSEGADSVRHCPT
jgi:hypothetical protein